MDNNNMMNNGFDPNQQPFDPNQNPNSNPNPQPFDPGQQPYAQNYNQPYTQGYDQPYQQGYDQTYQQGYGQPGYGQPMMDNNIYAQPGEGNGNTKAIISLVLGIISILVCCCYGVVSIILGIAAIVLAVLAKKDNMGKMPGMALGGLICGIIGLLLGLTFLVFMGIGIAGGALDEYYYY